MPKNKLYLGDGVYVEWERELIKLTTSDGINDTNTIYMEPQMVKALGAWLEGRLR